MQRHLQGNRMHRGHYRRYRSGQRRGQLLRDPQRTRADEPYYRNRMPALWSDVCICYGKSGQKLAAAAASVCAMGLAGEIGWSRMKDGEGNATYRNRIIDAVYQMDGDTLDREQLMRYDKQQLEKDLLLYAVTDRSWLDGRHWRSRRRKP